MILNYLKLDYSFNQKEIHKMQFYYTVIYARKKRKTKFYFHVRFIDRSLS